MDLILPIPIHKAKLRTRGYNQATEFAKGLSQGLKISLSEHVLVQKVFSVSQIQKSRTERYDNVKKSICFQFNRETPRKAYSTGG